MLFSVRTLAIIASSIHISAFLVYNKDIFQGKNQPSPVSWFLWAFITVFNFTSYQAMNDDWLVAMLPTVGSVMCILTFVFLVYNTLRLKRKIQKPDSIDIGILIFGIVIIVVWQVFKSAAYVNLVVQGCVAFSFIPTIRNLLRNRKNEKPLPWFLWTAAFFTGLIVVLLSWEGKYLSLVYPLNAIICHLGTAILALKKQAR